MSRKRIADRQPLVYVLILSYNGKRLTKDCIESVLRSKYNRFRIVVIDNGSVDGSVAALCAKFGRKIDILVNKINLGYARGFNVGLAHGFKHENADYCLVMNNDTIIDARAITELVKIAETDKRIGFVTGKVYYWDSPNTLQTVGKKDDDIRWNGDHIGSGEEDKGQYDSVRDLHFADDIFTLVSKRLYLALGGYNPLFFLQGEEYDWQARAKEAGYRIVYTPHAKLWHKVSMTIGKTSALKAYYDSRNPMLVLLLHRSPTYFRRYFWFHMKHDVLRGSLVSIKQLNFVTSLAKWQGFMSAVRWGILHRRFTVRHFV